jgi:hypothetical protein
MTTVTRDSITTSVLKRWPDKIGKKITPTPPPQFQTGTFM